MNREKTADWLAEGQSFELTVPLVVWKGTAGFRPESNSGKAHYRSNLRFDR
jgi:hypothetical protein